MNSRNILQKIFLKCALVPTSLVIFVTFSFFTGARHSRDEFSAMNSEMNSTVNSKNESTKKNSEH